MSDKVFKGNRGATGVFFMTLVTIATVVYWLNPPGNPGVDMACMIIIGFLIYGPVMLIGLHALELAPKKRRAPPRASPVCSAISAVPWPRAPSSAIPSISSAGTAALW
jgi:OPA family glycerol-3-phosphate transporter-like MFS transporter